MKKAAMMCAIGLALWSSVGAQVRIAPEVKAELYAASPNYAEGPTWRDGSVFFCSGALLRIGSDGKVYKYLDINPAGTFLLADGRILICDNKYHALLQVDKDGKVGVIADQFNGQPLRSLNDLTVDKAGNIYWTDPNSGDPKTPDGNVFRVTPEGKVDQIASGRAFPNGIEVDPAGKYLYLIQSASGELLRYDLPANNQGLGQPTVLYKFKHFGDGCAFDAAGNFWTTEYSDGEVIAISPEGKLLASIKVPAKAISNLTFGGKGRDTLFVTTGTPDAVFRIPVGVQGFAGHPGVKYKIQRMLDIKPLNTPLPEKKTAASGVGK